MDVRKIGLLVEQPFDGSYYWVIHEDVRHDGRFEALHRADRPFATYAAALAQGYGVMQRLCGLTGLPAYAARSVPLC
ncbi:MAG TPA: hypothetical protein VJ832_08885 [Variovorax sp.]|jgi:hypothetical protein|nr:hypothetical protein [Variovorax sp.]